MLIVSLILDASFTVDPDIEINFVVFAKPGKYGTTISTFKPIVTTCDYVCGPNVQPLCALHATGKEALQSRYQHYLHEHREHHHQPHGN